MPYHKLDRHQAKSKPGPVLKFHFLFFAKPNFCGNTLDFIVIAKKVIKIEIFSSFCKVIIQSHLEKFDADFPGLHY